jgi:hypothetical protein
MIAPSLILRPMLKSGVAVVLLSVSTMVARAQPTPPMLSLAEELRIDGKAHDWKQIRAVRSGPGGHILVGEQLGKTLRVFSADGQLLRTLGRYGQGPGEFRGIEGFGVLGDTIWVGDRALARLTFFDVAGNVLGTTRNDSGPLPARDADGRIVPTPQLSWAAPIALYPDGTGLVIPLMFATDADTLGNRAVYPYWRTTRRGQVLDTVLAITLESPMVRVTSSDGARRNFLQNPFPQREHAAASVDGRRLARVEASFAGRDAWSYKVRLSDERGRALYARRFAFTRAPVPKQTIDSLVEAISARYKGYARIREALPVPVSQPPVTKVLVARDGAVWLRGRDDARGATWTILGPHGEPTGSIRERPNSQFIAIDGGLWVIERDADDVESIVRYRVGAR